MTLDRKQLLALYDGLRVPDVADAMEAFGHRNIGSVSQDIMPLWRDVETCKHRICGFAFTVRFLPTNKALHADSIEDYKRKSSDFFSNFANCHNDMANIGEEDILVFDCGNIAEWGGFGSMFALLLKKNNVRGMVTNNSLRDTDDIIRMKFPVYCKRPGKGHRNFRSEYDACNVRINLGEALVCPGDMVVADGDGVVVVPIELAEKVGKFARGVLDSDSEFIENMGLSHLV